MKKLKKVLCLVMVAVSALSMSVSANAESIADDAACAVETEVTVAPDEKELVLVSREEVTLEDGQIVEVDTYLEDGIVALSNKQGSQYYKCTAKFMNAGKAEIVLWAWGTFHWNSADNRAYVIGAGSDYKIENSAYSYDNVEKSQGDDVGGEVFGKRYSYSEIKLKVKNRMDAKYTYKLKFDVNVEGEYHSNTGLKSATVSVTTRG